jgi:hypothetical protein
MCANVTPLVLSYCMHGRYSAQNLRASGDNATDHRYSSEPRTSIDRAPCRVRAPRRSECAYSAVCIAGVLRSSAGWGLLPEPLVMGSLLPRPRLRSVPDLAGSAHRMRSFSLLAHRVEHREDSPALHAQGRPQMARDAAALWVSGQFREQKRPHLRSGAGARRNTPTKSG